jgi:hypothetical protein
MRNEHCTALGKIPTLWESAADSSQFCLPQLMSQLTPNTIQREINKIPSSISGKNRAKLQKRRFVARERLRKYEGEERGWGGGGVALS